MLTILIVRKTGNIFDLLFRYLYSLAYIVCQVVERQH